MSRYIYDRVGTAATEYARLNEQVIWVFPVLTGSDPLHNLRAAEPPYTAFGQLALTFTFGNAASGTVAGTLWAWNSDSTAADDDSTIIKPDSVAADHAGRWLKVMATPTP